MNLLMPLDENCRNRLNFRKVFEGDLTSLVLVLRNDPIRVYRDCSTLPDLVRGRASLVHLEEVHRDWLLYGRI